MTGRTGTTSTRANSEGMSRRARRFARGRHRWFLAVSTALALLCAMAIGIAGAGVDSGRNAFAATPGPELVPFKGNARLEATWGPPSGGYHSANEQAIDIGITEKPVYASGDGTIDIAVTDNRNCNPLNHGTLSVGVAWCIANGFANSGTRLRIHHDNGMYSLYLHLSALTRTGGRVLAGEQVGVSGNTGISTGPHLHYAEFNRAGTAVDPGTMTACWARSPMSTRVSRTCT